MEEVFASVEAKNREIVAVNTWGHLAAKPDQKYQGTILFARGAYDDLVPISVEFEDLPDSPWFYEALWDFLIAQETECGSIYRFEGFYQWPKNGVQCFTGLIYLVEIEQ